MCISSLAFVNNHNNPWKNAFFAISAGVFLLLFSSSTAAEGSSFNDARHLVSSIGEYTDKHGNEAALKMVNSGAASTRKGELYLFAFDFGGKCIAHGVDKRLIGKNLHHLKDCNGKYFVREILTLAETRGSGIVQYTWYHPRTKKNIHKTTYIEKRNGIIWGCGYYT